MSERGEEGEKNCLANAWEGLPIDGRLCDLLTWGRGSRRRRKRPLWCRGGLSDGVLSSARSFVREGEERAGVSGLTNAWEGLLIGGRLCDFLPWKRGSRWRRKRPLWRREGYLTVFSRLHDCSGEGKGGRWVHLLAPGDGLFADAFFALWPFGEQRGKAAGGLFSTGGRQAAGAVFPLSCPACSFGSHSAPQSKGGVGGERSL